MNNEEMKIIDRTLIDLKHLMDKHDDATKLRERPKMQYFGRLCRLIDVATMELGWTTITTLMREANKNDEKEI